MTPIEFHHLLRRAGFACPFNKIDEFKEQNYDTVWKQIMEVEKKYTSLRFYQTDRPTNRLELKGKTKEEKKKLKDAAGVQILSLKSKWFHEMVNAPYGIREKMALFWHSNLACRSPHYYATEDYLDIIRKNALGNFKTLITEISHSMCMLEFLNNQQNKKQSPNENFGRELLELFTLGRGNYTEKDIKEASRAFTGWGFDPASAQYEFKTEWHDDGEKEFLGKKGPWNGEDIIRIIFENPLTAEHISRKVYRWFVSETPDETRIKTGASLFYKSNYDIQLLLKYYFTSDWFYNEKSNLIKNPIELLVGISRVFGLQFNNDGGLQKLMQILGMALFFPPNVSGWPLGRSWIDNSRLMVRLNLPFILLDKGAPIQSEKDDLQDLMIYNKDAKSVDTAWGALHNTKCLEDPIFQGSDDELISKLTTILLSQNSSSKWVDLIKKPVPKSLSSTPRSVQIAMRMMATPEFQIQ